MESTVNHKDDLFTDLGNYSETMSISQVVKYFERHNVDSFTKTMIQNYIRVGVLPQPEDKRRYTKKQLCVLALIDCLKGTFSLDEIKSFFDYLDDTEDWYSLYLRMIKGYNAALDGGKNKQVLDLMAKSAAYKKLALDILKGENHE